MSQQASPDLLELGSDLALRSRWSAGHRSPIWRNCNRGCVLVYEDLHMPQPQQGKIRGRALQRRLSLWQHGAIRQAATNQAEAHGMRVAKVDPHSTSKACSRCGLRGTRKRHVFSCPHCGFTLHADINVARNIRNRYTVFRDSGDSSMSLEAQTAAVVGKPLPITAWGK